MQVVIKNQIWVTEAELCVKLGINSYFLRKMVKAKEVTHYKLAWLNVYAEGSVELTRDTDGNYTDPIEITIEGERWYHPKDFARRMGLSHESVRRWEEFDGKLIGKDVGTIHLVRFHPLHVTLAQIKKLG